MAKSDLIRVLHVVSVDKENYYLNNLADYSDPGRVEHRFVTLADVDCEFVRTLKMKGRDAWGLGLAGKKNIARAYRKIKRILGEERPDVVHVHLFEPSLIGSRAAKKLGIRTVLTRHHSDAIHQLPSRLKRKLFLRLESYISRNSDHIIAPSTTVRDYLVSEEVPPEKISVIPYGQTTERFDAVTPEKVAEVRAELGMGGGISLVNVSRLFHRKGHSDLFRAFAELTGSKGVDATLYLVGDGDHRGELEAMCGRLGIHDRVRFLGWRSDALAIVAASDLVVHPSLEDALSSAVIEAVMLEKPIVATDISGVRDSLDNGKYGRIVPPSDPDALLAAILDVLGKLPEAKARAKAGRKYLLEYMDAGQVASAYTQVYQKVLCL